MQRARVRALKDRAGHVIRNKAVELEVTEDKTIQVKATGQVVGDPLSVDWTPNGETVQEGGYNVLVTEASESMVVGRKMIADLAQEWTLLQPVQVWARYRAWDSALIVSHSLGALVYLLHPILWSDAPNEGTDPRLVLAVLVDQLGPEHRAPADIPPTGRVEFTPGMEQPWIKQACAMVSPVRT